MNTSTNILQALFITLNIFAFIFLAKKMTEFKNQTLKLFGYSIVLLSLVEFCVLGVTMLWTLPILDFKSLQYLFYLYAIILLFATSASVLRPKIRYYTNIFLAFVAILVTGIFFVERNLNNATAYTINYYLSFDNPATLNIFSLTVALSLGMAALVIAQYFKDKKTRMALESSLLIVTISLVISLIVYNDTVRFISSIIQLLSLAFICFYFVKYPPSKLKLKN